jgi:YHS domain-containing protein
MEKILSSKELVDPVCLMKVNPKQQNPKFTYHEQAYYFCNENCRDLFESNPEKYLNKKSRKKGIWGRYLERLAKQTGGKGMKCH